LKAIVYKRPYEIAVEEVPDPKIKDPNEIIVRVTSTAICGTDLHIFHGLLPQLKEGLILGHEFMGIVEEVGKSVTKWKKGDRVLVPAIIACGKCDMCQSGLTSHCIKSNEHGEVAAAYGHGEALGGIHGGQAEYVRVPYADVNPIEVPKQLSDEQVLFLSDILPTAYWITDVSGIKSGDSVAVFGCGPVGLLAQRCARFKGADRIFAVDHIDYRLQFAARINPGVETIHFKEEDPGEKILQLTNGRGADVVIDAIGFEAEPTKLYVAAVAQMQRMGMPQIPGLRPEDQPPFASVSAINWEVEAVRHGGTLGLAGFYGGKANGFPIGEISAIGITIKAGPAIIHSYLGELLGYIAEGRLNADDIISLRLPRQEAARAYHIFSQKEDNCVKVVLYPSETFMPSQ
jgi:S-(hydroxymethyl)glutathione dehydrogenase/alcohol dehydrogenase